MVSSFVKKIPRSIAKVEERLTVLILKKSAVFMNFKLPRLHIGMRTVKTVTAVIIAMVIVDLYGATSSKLILAILGAMAAVQPTFKDSLESCLTQFAGVFFGAVVSVLLMMLPLHPLVASGIGIVLVITLYNLLGIRYSPALACMIVVSMCYETDARPIVYAAGRIWDSSIGLAIGIPLYLLKVQLPDIIMEPVAGFANLNTPLAMIVVGSNIAKVKIKDFLTDKKVYAASFIRLIVAPAILIGMLCLIRPNHDLFMSTSIQAAAPVAANCVLFSVMFNQDSGLASKLVAASTCLSIITIPLMTVLAQMVAGLVL